jgi:hypothetical protein
MKLEATRRGYFPVIDSTYLMTLPAFEMTGTIAPLILESFSAA